MKTKKLMLSLIAVLGVSALSAISAHATTYYVRDGGGDYGTTSTTCNGQTNAIFTGNNGPNCALNHPAWVIGAVGEKGKSSVQLLSSGDTLFIDGDSDTNPGTQAQYVIGFGMPNTGSGVCDSGAEYFCILADIPAGTSNSVRTSIIGTGTHKPQLWSIDNAYQVISSPNNHILLQWLEVTDHYACAYNDPANACPALTGNTEFDGITLSGDDVNLTDIYVHGISRYGINGGSFGNATFTRVWAVGNGSGGIQIGSAGNQSVTGTLTFNQPIVEWNGCVEAYPMAAGIDNPSNYSNCFGQASGGYGDGLAFGATTGEAPGNWTIIGPGSISFNTQDGLDILHGNLSGTDSIDKMRFEGNAGQQIKITGLNDFVTNSVIIGDCGWWYGAPQSLAGGMQPGDACRAQGDTILFAVTNSSTATWYNNTILTNAIAFNYKDTGSTGCNANTSIKLYNNIVLGGYSWLDDRTWNNSGSNSMSSYLYASGSDNDGAGTCGNTGNGSGGILTPVEDYNIVQNMRNNNSGCNGTHDKCGTTPGFASVVPMGTAGGAANTFYQGNAAVSLLSLSNSSAAIVSGVTGLNYWNNSNDYHNVTRTNPPAVGALEQGSCAIDSYGCLLNSDCCTGTCSNSVCGTGGTTAAQPVVSITNPQNGSSVSDGANVTVTAAASETNGTISNISLYSAAGVLLGSSKKSPFNYVQNNVLAGNYTYTAQATDANGVSVSSSPVTMTVTPASILPSLPVIAISSPGGNAFTAGSNVTIAATASENNGSISKISIYNGVGLLLGVSNTSSYNYLASNLPAGVYTFIAQATDAFGVSVFSLPIIVTVNSPVSSGPTVSLTSPISNASYTLPASLMLTSSASANAGTVIKVDYYNGSSYLGTSFTSPYRLMLINVPSGNYNLTAKVTDNTGATAISSMVSVSVGSHISPMVSLMANNTSYTAPASIVLTANASETNGLISKVMFYNGSTLLGTDTSSPYNFTWSNVPAGNYSLTAVAYDTNNNQKTSTAVAVTVSGLPVVSLVSNNTSFMAPANVVLTATASESNGTISQVAFYNGATLLGTDTSSPYNFTWSNVSAGTYNLTAVATDSTGASVTSSMVSVTVGVPHVAPTVSFTSPVNNASYTLPASIMLSANAMASNATISRVDFYNGATLLGTATSIPYTFTWNNMAAGNYNLTAVATDSTGATGVSSMISITIVNPSHVAPIVSLTSPANNSSYTLPTSIVLSANAVATNSTVSRVDFYNGSTILGSATNSPYTFTWSNMAAGTYSLIAVVTDSTGATATSSIALVTINAAHAAPTVSLTSPTNNASYIAPASIVLTANAVANNATVSRVDFYNGSTLLGSAVSSPYAFTWNNMAAGNYSLTAVATDSTGATAVSSTVSVTVTAHAAPTVSLTSPTSSASYTAPASIVLTANAVATNATVSRVDFYNGSTLLGTALSSPYTYTWNNAAVGTYSLVAVVTDSMGATATSAIVSVTVVINSQSQVGPTVSLTSPVNNASYTTPSILTLTANASDSSARIVRVDYYNGSTYLGSSLSSPYRLMLINIAAGTYHLTAKATDSNGLTATSTSATVTVAKLF